MIEGWLTDGQAARLAAAAARSRPDGAVVEIGSFRGKSAVVLASTAGSLIAIDPHAGSDRGPQEIEADATRGNADFDAFHANLAAAGVADRVRHVRKFSDDAHQDVTGPLSLLYVDGAHRFGPARSSPRRSAQRRRPATTSTLISTLRANQGNSRATAPTSRGPDSTRSYSAREPVRPT